METAANCRLLLMLVHDFRWGIIVAKNPWKLILGSILVAATCAIGLLNFTAENRPTKLWIPQDSGFVENSEWLQQNFPNDIRLQSFALVNDDVLRPEILLWVLLSNWPALL